MTSTEKHQKLSDMQKEVEVKELNDDRNLYKNDSSSVS